MIGLLAPVHVPVNVPAGILYCASIVASFAVTVYPVIGALPSNAGGVNAMDAVLFR